MRYAVGCLCSAMFASVFTLWLAQPSENRAAAQEAGPALPGAPAGPSQTEPPGLPPRRPLVPGARPSGDAPIPAPSGTPRGSFSPAPGTTPMPGGAAVPNGALFPNGAPGSTGAPFIRPVPDPISTEGLDRRKDPQPVEPNASDSKTRPLFDGPDTSDGLTPEEAVNVSVYEKSNRSVVNITSKGLPGERFLFMEVPADGSGSGAVIDREGRILTNYHVVENAQQVEVTLFDGSNHPATFVGADPVNDLAVIKVDVPADKLFPVEIGDSSRLKVGMRVYAIGNPFGLERTMTTGIVSSLNRSLQIRGTRSIKAIIQIDAAVNPGNSGGPLLDSRGQLVGVNTAIATRTGQSAGVGFAIPATLVSRVVPELVRHGRVIRPEIGIQQVLETEEGLRIASLTAGGPAERAGLRGPQLSRTRRGPFVFDQVDRAAADLIVAVDGEEVKTADDFLGLVEAKHPGDTVVLTVIRGKQSADVAVVLASPPLDVPGPPGQIEPAP